MQREIGAVCLCDCELIRRCDCYSTWLGCNYLSLFIILLGLARVCWEMRCLSSAARNIRNTNTGSHRGGFPECECGWTPANPCDDDCAIHYTKSYLRLFFQMVVASANRILHRADCSPLSSPPPPSSAELIDFRLLAI